MIYLGNNSTHQDVVSTSETNSERQELDEGAHAHIAGAEYTILAHTRTSES
jgi:hypothetical protein